MIRLGTAPAAIITLQAEQILAVGSIIGRSLYGRAVPLYVIGRADYERAATGKRVVLDKACIVLE